MWSKWQYIDLCNLFDEMCDLFDVTWLYESFYSVKMTVQKCKPKIISNSFKILTYRIKISFTAKFRSKDFCVMRFSFIILSFFLFNLGLKKIFQEEPYAVKILLNLSQTQINKWKPLKWRWDWSTRLKFYFYLFFLSI